MTRRSVRDVLVYLLSSLCVGGVYLGMLYVMDTLVRTAPTVSVTVAYVGAMVIYFLVSKLAVFHSRSRAGAGRELTQFAIVVTVNYFLTQLIVQGVRRLTHEIYSGSIVAGVVTISLTYVLFDRIVFRHHRKPR